MRGRTELYLRLPMVDPHDLLPFLHGLGHEAALGTLDRALPDGLRRLAGRRLGLSVAYDNEGRIELALFATARSLFPGDPAMVTRLVPSVARLDSNRVCRGLVTLGLDPTGRRMTAALGVPAMAPARRGAHAR
jgi:hypothetical protein